MNGPIRVLLVLATLNQGGAENLVMNLYREIDRDQIQFDIIVHRNERGAFDAEVESLGGRLYHAPQYTGMNYFQYVRWWEMFLSDHPEYRILHSHISSYASLFFPVAKKHGLKTISHSHNTSNGKGFASVAKNLLQFPLRFQADYMFACSMEAGKFVYGEKAVEKENFRFIPNGIDCERFAFSEENRARVRKELGIENNFVVGHVGRHTFQKNPLFLMEIFAELYKRDRSVRLLQIGGGGMTEQMKQKCRELGIADAVIFAGVHADVEKYYSAMDLFLLPSLYEGLAIVLIEAQANGLVCVVADEAIPKAAEVAENLFTRVSLKADAAAWAEELLKRKSGAADRGGDESVANSQFNIKKVASDLTAFYERLYDRQSNKTV